MRDESEHWTERSVSMLQLLVASLTLVLAGASAFVTLLLTNEARMTRFEERQNANTRGIAEVNVALDRSQLQQDAKFESMREDILKKLDIIGADVVILRITFAKQEARERNK